MIPYGKHYVDEEDVGAVAQVIRNGMLTQGPIIEEFEKAVSRYVGSKYAVAVSSGTAALHLANKVAGVKPGANIVTSPITFVSTANAARFCGGEVFFSDIELDTINMCPSALGEALNEHKNIRAVCPVHFAGHTCDMVKIKELADAHNAVIIEDGAHAFGAKYKSGNRVGCCENSLMTIFSFHPVKSIAAGEGGMITTNDYDVYRQLLRLRSHGINKLDDELSNVGQAMTNGILNPWYYEMQELGFHYRFTDIHASLGLSQLSKIEKFMDRRTILANQYDNIFSEFPEYFSLQHSDRTLSANHIYVVRFNLKRLKISRAELMNKLKSKGINSQVHYLPVPMHPFYQKSNDVMGRLKSATEYYENCLSIPLYYGLSDEQQNYVIKNLLYLIETKGN